MLYLIRCNDFYKIGYTSGRLVEPRLSALQTSTPYHLEIVASGPGSLREERSLHAHLEHCNARGEWFRLSDSEVAAVIKYLSTPENERQALPRSEAMRKRTKPMQGRFYLCCGRKKRARHGMVIPCPDCESKEAA